MNCLICGGRVAEFVKNNNYTYYKCEDCGTSQILPQLSIETILEYYNKFHLSDTKGGTYDWVEERMQLDFPAKVKLIKKYIKGNKEIFLLDVGCGKGFFLKMVSNHGMKAMGIDISESAITHAKNVLRQDVIKSNIEDLSNREQYQGKFDIVTSWATIEHVVNPLTFLKCINKLLKVGGILFLDTGIDSYILRKFLVGHCQWYSAIEHLFVFSEKGLKILLSEAELEILKFYKNYERNIVAKIKKWLQINYLCLASSLFLKPVLTPNQYLSMKKETKWPIGYRVLVIAKKNE